MPVVKTPHPGTTEWLANAWPDPAVEGVHGSVEGSYRTEPATGHSHATVERGRTPTKRAGPTAEGAHPTVEAAHSTCVKCSAASLKEAAAAMKALAAFSLRGCQRQGGKEKRRSNRGHQS